jgi:hypothetical protein
MRDRRAPARVFWLELFDVALVGAGERSHFTTDVGGGLIETHCRAGAYGPAGREPDVGHQNVCAGIRHGAGLLFVKHVWCREHSALVRRPDHVNFELVPHACFFKIPAEDPVEKSHRGKILDAGEPQPCKLFQKDRHQRIRGKLPQRSLS